MAWVRGGESNRKTIILTIPAWLFMVVPIPIKVLLMILGLILINRLLHWILKILHYPKSPKSWEFGTIVF